MKKTLFKAFLIPFMVVSVTMAASPADDSSVSANYRNNRYPLLQKTYMEFEVNPKSWTVDYDANLVNLY